MSSTNLPRYIIINVYHKAWPQNYDRSTSAPPTSCRPASHSLSVISGHSSAQTTLQSNSMTIEGHYPLCLRLGGAPFDIGVSLIQILPFIYRKQANHENPVEPLPRRSLS